MANLSKSATSGNLFKNAVSNNLANNCDLPYKLTPCWDDTDIGDCGHCSGLDVPKDITLNFYDLATCDTDKDGDCWYWNAGGEITDFSVVIPQTAYCIWQKDDVSLPAAVLGQTLYKSSDLSCTEGDVETLFSVRLQKSNVPAANTLRVIIWAKHGGFLGVRLFHGSTTTDPCDWDNRDLDNNFQNCATEDGQLSHGGYVNIGFGGGTGDCPGGAPIYISKSETSLAARVGKVIRMGGICYQVSVSTIYAPVTTLATFTNYDDCDSCCSA